MRLLTHAGKLSFGMIEMIDTLRKRSPVLGMDRSVLNLLKTNGDDYGESPACLTNSYLHSSQVQFLRFQEILPAEEISHVRYKPDALKQCSFPVHMIPSVSRTEAVSYKCTVQNAIMLALLYTVTDTPKTLTRLV